MHVWWNIYKHVHEKQTDASTEMTGAAYAL